MTQPVDIEQPDRQGEVVAFLSNSASYGCTGLVERIETHAAIVFLVADRAYKLKRAVRYPYLDFSTASKRKEACETELALNRRTAPDLYLETSFVGRGPDGRLALGKGEPVDWLIVMRRFASDCLMDTMAKRGSLDPAMLRQLADAIARFHDLAEIVADEGSSRVARVIEGNRASMLALSPGTLDAGLCEVLFDESRVLLERLSPLLDRRAAEGFVRRCHGDMHLANICIWQGKPTLFDCLEFDADLATSDVLYDLAFLLMDIWQRGLQKEASLVFNRYCDRRGEVSGLAALPLFLSMRAAVRSHVEASAAAGQADRWAREAKLTRARDYLAGAIALLKQPVPRLIAVGGISGSGKSTLAANLAPHIGAAPGARWLRTDVLRKQLAGVDPETPLPNSAYTTAAHEAVYSALTARAGEKLRAGWPVIVDAVFDLPETRNRVEAIAAEMGVPFTGLWLEASREILLARVRSRTGDASDAGPQIVDKQLERDIGSLGSWHVVESGGSVAGTLDCARAFIQDGRRCELRRR
ncbi:MAG: AAA family ATPase [Alphaproteobacteria bacterium]|nr:AAA family ATPase [Alphaproteobacteria bacterium]